MFHNFQWIEPENRIQPMYSQMCVLIFLISFALIITGRQTIKLSMLLLATEIVLLFVIYFSYTKNAILGLGGGYFLS
jgi:hypothetical protein